LEDILAGKRNELGILSVRSGLRKLRKCPIGVQGKNTVRTGRTNNDLGKEEGSGVNGGSSSRLSKRKKKMYSSWSKWGERHKIKNTEQDIPPKKKGEKPKGTGARGKKGRGLIKK